jgi:hypothetical protein
LQELHLLSADLSLLFADQGLLLFGGFDQQCGQAAVVNATRVLTVVFVGDYFGNYFADFFGDDADFVLARICEIVRDAAQLYPDSGRPKQLFWKLEAAGNPHGPEMWRKLGHRAESVRSLTDGLRGRTLDRGCSAAEGEDRGTINLRNEQPCAANNLQIHPSR